MVISADGYARLDGPGSSSAAGSKVELTQSEQYVAQGQSISSDKVRHDLDSISTETTQEGESPPPLSGQTGTIVPPKELLAPSRGRLGYLLAGIGATLVSAVVTWQLTNAPQKKDAHRDPTLGEATSAGGGPVLRVHDVPATEPPPAPLVPDGETTSPAGPGSASVHTAQAAAGADGGEASASADSGEVELATNPPGVEVYMHRKLLGTTPLVLHELPLDSDVKFELRLAGYKKKHKHIKWKGATHLNVTVKMQTDVESEGEDSDGAASQPGQSEKTAPEPAKQAPVQE
jgi:hypothetical protein